ncbi:DUF4435 domain-containing protein [Exiguobacterium indicum]|uniref:DUF4435 domain-containing protein n=1 Tax=Exiguobacterium indicum TaxID=296995 RepID=UPI003981E3A0
MFKLPDRPQGKEAIEFDQDSFKSIVLLGANGSGKTRMSIWLEDTLVSTHRISAQKSLNIPEFVETNNMKSAEENFRYGTTDVTEDLAKRFQLRYRWNENPVTHLLNDFRSLLQLLYTEEFNASVRYKDSYEEGKATPPPKTKLDIIKEIWEDVFPHRKLSKGAGIIEVSLSTDPGAKYNSSEMSDGERLAFYYIGAVLCAHENATIIIDEPENHLHSSIIKKLWDKIEPYRSDCKFVYLTHDIDFAITRNEAKLIWIKSYLGNNIWDYEDVTDLKISKDIYLEIMGNRSPIIFVEGDANKSLDYRLYQELYNDYDIIPLSSCSKVIELTKSLRQIEEYYRIDVIGIIDRDRRSDEELESLKDHGIYSLEVSEIENLFLVEEIVRFMTEKESYNVEEIFSQHKEKVIQIFEGNLEKEVFDHARQQLSNKIINRLNGRLRTKEDYIEMLSTIGSSIEENTRLFDEKNAEFSSYIEAQDYSSILKVINQKDLIHKSRLAESIGLTKKGYYEKVLNILKKNDEESERLKNIFQPYINFPISI